MTDRQRVALIAGYGLIGAMTMGYVEARNEYRLERHLIFSGDVPFIDGVVAGCFWPVYWPRFWVYSALRGHE